MRRSVVALVCLVPASAHAEKGDFKVAGWYGKAGGMLGTVLARDRGTGFVIGGVATLVHLDSDYRWYGAQVDLALDTNGDAPMGGRWTIGPEAGTALFGALAGYYGEHVDGETRHGVFGGVKVTIGFLAAYARVTHVVTSDTDPTAVDLGLQIKTLVWGKED
jgi:hypothetical protein